ncbi:MAG: DUF1624 domain-containing protein [Sphingobacteriaceae bacterium]|nr:MAG: DUF1624 domain-containing protein [Sphingobacteriaceae bacterium]
MTSVTAQSKKRVESIDILRGIIMIIMALDHTRDFFMAQLFDPTDLTKASTGLYLTRFVTHLCAPAFVFLAGTGAFLSLNRGKTKKEASVFLFTRGLWLVILELTLVGFAWTFELDYHFFNAQVLWALGFSMIALAALVYLPLPVIVAVGLIMIFGHNMLDNVSPADFNKTGGIIWQFLHVEGMVELNKNLHIYVLYPLIPWIGVMAVGYCFGVLFKLESAKRVKMLLAIGIGALIFFIVNRGINAYGDMHRWTDQHDIIRTTLSFINVQKYPPSLDYLLITLGTLIVLLAVFEHVQNRFTNIVLVFGRIPLFYYVLHLYVLHSASVITQAILLPAGQAIETTPWESRQGFSLPVVYAIWLLLIFALYFPCRWYMKYKMTHKHWWLSYL